MLKILASSSYYIIEVTVYAILKENMENFGGSDC
jgi:hypothetical protein